MPECHVDQVSKLTAVMGQNQTPPQRPVQTVSLRNRAIGGRCFIDTRQGKVPRLDLQPPSPSRVKTRRETRISFSDEGNLVAMLTS